MISSTPSFQQFDDIGDKSSTFSEYSEAIIAGSGFNAIQRLNSLARLEDDWDGPDSIAPSGKSIERSRDIIKFLILAPCSFEVPSLSVDRGNGEVCLEWWIKDRKLTIFVLDLKVTYLKSWGSDFVNEMEDGDIDNNIQESLLGLYGWVLNIS